MKMQNIQCVISVLTGSYAIANISEVLSVIILILSILNILWSMIYGIYRHVKNKEYDKIDDEINDAKSKLETLNNSKNKEED